MQKEPSIDLKKYNYTLPEASIALEGTTKRADSKLLYYHQGQISDHHFTDVVDLLPASATLVFNNTKVIPARLFMQKSTGATLELFLLKPAHKVEINTALVSTEKTVWQCMIGNLKKWPETEVLSTSMSIGNTPINLQATLVDRTSKIVAFSWNNPDITFSQILDCLGNTPLPPYIKRPTTLHDKERYQTVYSKINGAVAAPTAGLHFTKDILSKLRSKNIQQQYLTLHVGAGTFMPIKAATVAEHPMHNETMQVAVSLVESLLTAHPVIAVGTTSMRTLESLYWWGVKLIKNPAAGFHIEKLFPYQQTKPLPTRQQALQAVLAYAQSKHLQELTGDTEIFIFPGYKFKVCDGLITNFHQPGSTLILLVAAFIGHDWKNIYAHALQNNYRFLSFGDSSLLIPTP